MNSKFSTRRFRIFLWVGLSSIFLYLLIQINKKPLWFRSVSIDDACPRWKNFSSIDVNRYERCFYRSRNDDFWPVERLRHEAFKNLLNSSSFIIEIGGNIGYDTQRFIELYDPSIITFEPLVKMAKDLERKFSTNPKVEVRPVGLGNRKRKEIIKQAGSDNSGSSIFHKNRYESSPRVEEIQIENIVNVINEIRMKQPTIDMLTMNCEGCEFEILDALIENDLLKHFRIVQIASHVDLLPDGHCQYCLFQQRLDDTHRIIYHYFKLWEAWIRCQ